MEMLALEGWRAVGASMFASNDSVQAPSAGALVSLAVITAVWWTQIMRLRTFWHYNPPLGSPVSVADRRPMQASFRRQAPAGLIAGGFFLIAGWLGVLSSKIHSIWIAVPAVFCGVVALVGIMVTLNIWIFNRPKRFVPPNLRDAPGLFARRKPY